MKLKFHLIILIILSCAVGWKIAHAQTDPGNQAVLPLDTINYIFNAQTNTATKTVVDIQEVTNINSELSALNAQITDLENGIPNNTPAITAAIANYGNQIQILQANGAAIQAPPVVVQAPLINSQANAQVNQP